MKKRGFTLAEAVVTLLIISMLSVILYPVVSSVRRKIDIMSSSGKLRQISVAIEIYRQDWDGVDVFYDHRSFYRVGLPLTEYRGLPGLDYSYFTSPCASDPVDQVMSMSAFMPGAAGAIKYVATRYAPSSLEWEPHEINGNRSEYLDYLPTYKQNIVLMVEPYCNPAGTNMMAPLVKKRGIALLLSGQVVSRYATGDASRLQWYSSPAD